MYLQKLYISIFALFFIVSALTATQAVGASLKNRMKARIPEINSLKDAGIIGENNRGYLDFLGSKQPKKNVLNAENSDRKKVYSSIAKKQGVDMLLVGQRRAKQIIKITKPGHKYQTADGKWHTK